MPSDAEPSASAISGSVRGRRLIRAAVRCPISATRKNSSAPPAISCHRVGGASPVGRGAGPMTTRPAFTAAGSASSSLFMASWSVVRSFSRSVRACTLSTVLPGSAASASSVIRLLVCATICRSAASCAAASGSPLSPTTCAA